MSNSIHSHLPNILCLIQRELRPPTIDHRLRLNCRIISEFTFRLRGCIIGSKMSTKVVLTDRVSECFIQEGETEFYMCTICKPNKRISGKKKFNLVSHIRSCHPHVLENSNELEFELKKEKLRIVQSLSEIVTVNGRPFKCLLDSGLLRLIRKDLDRLEKLGHGIVLNKNVYEIKEYVIHIACEIKKCISAEVQKKMVSVLVDIGSKNRTSILGIGIQFMKDDTVKNVAIGMIPLTKAHTASYIVDELIKCLNSYGIAVSQTFAIVSDNGSNMLAAAKRLDKFINEQRENEENTEQELPDFNRMNLNEEDILNDVEEMIELDSILNDDDNYDELFAEVIGELAKHTTSVITIRCGAHSIQLCVRAALKKSNLNAVLTLCKYVVRKLHTQSIKYEIHEKGVESILPHPSNDTRWDSDLEMVTLFKSDYYNIN